MLDPWIIEEIRRREEEERLREEESRRPVLEIQIDSPRREPPDRRHERDSEEGDQRPERGVVIINLGY